MSLPPGPLSPALIAVLDFPAALPPAGVTANLIDPHHSPLGLSNVLVCTVLITIAVSLRFYTKIFIMKKLIVEDYFLLLGYLSTIAYYGCGIVVDNFAKGTHQWNVRVRDFVNVIYWTQICGTVYIPAMLFLKIAILCQFLRIFVVNKSQSRALWLAIWINIWALVAYYIFQFFFNFFLCSPRWKLWDPFLEEGKCLNRYATWTVNGAVNLATDVIILVLPVWSVMKLNMPWKRKAGYIAIFGIGIIACITSAMRVSMWNILKEEDLTKNLIKFGVWTAWELAMGVIIASTPGLPRFFQTYSPKVSQVFSKLISKSRSGSHSVEIKASDASSDSDLSRHSPSHPVPSPYYVPMYKTPVKTTVESYPPVEVSHYDFRRKPEEEVKNMV